MGAIRDCGLITTRPKMSLDGPARRSDVDASAEPARRVPLRMARQPSCARLPVGRGRGQEAPRRVRGRDASGRTAFMIAAQRGCKEAVKVLLEHEKGMSDSQSHNALYHALKGGHTEVAKIAIPHEDPTDGNGVTALMRAAARGDPEMVGLLAPLQKGAKDKDGNTAFLMPSGANTKASLCS